MAKPQNRFSRARCRTLSCVGHGALSAGSRTGVCQRGFYLPDDYSKLALIYTCIHVLMGADRPRSWRRRRIGVAPLEQRREPGRLLLHLLWGARLALFVLWHVPNARHGCCLGLWRGRAQVCGQFGFVLLQCRVDIVRLATKVAGEARDDVDMDMGHRLTCGYAVLQTKPSATAKMEGSHVAQPNPPAEQCSMLRLSTPFRSRAPHAGRIGRGRTPHAAPGLPAAERCAWR